MINWLRDYFGIPKEEYEWDREDMIIMLIAGFIFLFLGGVAAYDAISFKRINYLRRAMGCFIVSSTFILYSFYSFISYLVLTLRNRRNL